MEQLSNWKKFQILEQITNWNEFQNLKCLDYSIKKENIKEKRQKRENPIFFKKKRLNGPAH
jgi:hypothetical protein